jgi:hypothetical protein
MVKTAECIDDASQQHYSHCSPTGGRMRQSMTIRIDQDLLNQAKACAVLENRTLTNYIETLILRDVRPPATKSAHTTNETSLTVFMPEPSTQRLLTLERDGDTPQELAQRQAYLDLISGWTE